MQEIRSDIRYLVVRDRETGNETGMAIADSEEVVILTREPATDTSAPKVYGVVMDDGVRVRSG